MEVFLNKISLLILIKFFLLNKVLTQSLSIQSDGNSSTHRNFNEELSKRVKNRLSHYGSLKTHKAPESVTNEKKAPDSYLQNDNTEKKEEPTKNVLADGPKNTETSYPAPYLPKDNTNFLYSDFEAFMSKQSKEKLEKCTKAPHDFVLLVDESGSVSSYNWHNHVKSFVQLVTTAVAQVNGDNKLSIVQFASSPKMVMQPRQVNKTTLPDALKVIDNMFGTRRTHGTTNTGAALKFVRKEILDPSGKFSEDLAGGKPPVFGENKIVILFTDGQTKDPEDALTESLVARYNGVDLFVFGIGSVNQEECRKLVGCSMEGECKNFIHANWNSVVEYLHELVFSMCRDSARNAICLENWSEYSECSVPCGGGVKKSKLLNFTTASEATTGPDGLRGLTCEEQFHNVAEKTLPCNEFPCPDTLVEINQHTPEEVPTELRKKQYNAEGKAEDVEEQEEDHETLAAEDESEEKKQELEKAKEAKIEEAGRDTTMLGRVLNELRSGRQEHPQPDRGSGPSSLTTETEVNERTQNQPRDGGETANEGLGTTRDTPVAARNTLYTTRSNPETRRTVPDTTRTNPETTQSEVKERREPNGAELSESNRMLNELLDENSRSRAPPFRIIGEHRNVKVDHVLGQDELNRLDRPVRIHAGGDRAESNIVRTVDKSVQTVSKTDQGTQTLPPPPPPPSEPPATPQTEGQDGRPEGANEPSKHSSPEINLHDFTFRFNTQHLPNMKDLKKSLSKVEDKVLSVREKIRQFLKNQNMRKIVSVMIVIAVSAISISLFSYVFLGEKQTTQQLFDPADQDFMNAGDGDDVEPSENYQVSNMEDGIWA